MKASAMYGPEPIKPETFETIDAIHGTITDVISKNLEYGPRLIVTLDGIWSLIINATAARTIRAAYGDETTGWVGQPLTVYRGTVRFGGKEQDGVLVRIPPEKVETAPPREAVAAGELGQDDIPF